MRAGEKKMNIINYVRTLTGELPEGFPSFSRSPGPLSDFHHTHPSPRWPKACLELAARLSSRLGCPNDG